VSEGAILALSRLVLQIPKVVYLHG
jgi:hypothetical protein